MKDIVDKARALLKGKLMNSPATKADREIRSKNISILYAKGMSIIELGKVYNISKQRVSQILLASGVQAQENKDEKALSNLIASYREKVEKLKVKVKHNRELFEQEHLKVLNLTNQLERRDAKIARLEEELLALKLNK